MNFILTQAHPDTAEALRSILKQLHFEARLFTGDRTSAELEEWRIHRHNA